MYVSALNFHLDVLCFRQIFHNILCKYNIGKLPEHADHLVRIDKFPDNLRRFVFDVVSDIDLGSRFHLAKRVNPFVKRVDPGFLQYRRAYHARHVIDFRYRVGNRRTCTEDDLSANCAHIVQLHKHVVRSLRIARLA